MIGALAAQQHGVVTRAQLTDLGLSDRAIDHRLDSGRVYRVHRGVYAVGHPRLTREGRWLAAVLALGDGAVLSHRSAAALWRIGTAERRPAPLEVTAPRDAAPRPGIRAHRSELDDAERTTRGGIPVTTPARTILDLAAVVGPRPLTRALEEAEALRLTRAAAVATLLARHPGRRGAANLRIVLARHDPAAGEARSELERRFLRLVRAAGLPPPSVNALVRIGGRTIEADLAWPEQRVIVELDGRAWHDTRAAFERDRARDRMLQAAGWRVIRVTWAQLKSDAGAVIADLATVLGSVAGQEGVGAAAPASLRRAGRAAAAPG